MNVLLVDQQPIFRKGLVYLLSAVFGDISFGEAGSGDEAITLLNQKVWDILILELSLLGESALDFLARVDRSRSPKPRVIVFGIHSEARYAMTALKKGADAYLSKSSSPEELIKAVREVASGGKYISGELAEKLAYALDRSQNNPVFENLSDQDLRLLTAVAEGKLESEIAHEMHLSIKTVSVHRTRIMRKINLRNTAEMVRYALDHELLSSDFHKHAPD